ncbi:MAG: zinc-binding dehydrogenase [Chloroflexi bacterium]|nr:zinc-binding dehydrogenase [Chloroflexota bacterium]
MRTIYVDKDIPRSVVVKALKPIWYNVVYSALSPVHYVDIPQPVLPGARWVRLENLICGICASDLMLLNVDADPRIGLAALPGLERFYLGHEVVSRVLETGSDVSTLRVGDRVIMQKLRLQGATCFSQEIEPRCQSCAMGNYSTCENTSLGQGPIGVGGGWGDGYIAHELEVLKVPDSLSDEEAAMVEPLAVGVRTALRRLPQVDEKVLVVGSGMVGLDVIMALRALSPDCHISAMARYPQQIEMTRHLGVDEVIIDEDGYEATARITGAKTYDGMFGVRMALGGFDSAYDCVGSAQTLQDSLRWARAGGTVVMAGIKTQPLSLDLSPIWHQEIDLIGLNSHGMESWQGAQISTYDLTIELIKTGKLSIDGLITHRFPLEQWRRAIATAQDKSTGSIKVIFDYRME